MDLIMAGMAGSRGKNYRKELARELGVSVQTVAKHLEGIYWHYGIDRERYRCMVRLVYLRAKELGLI